MSSLKRGAFCKPFTGLVFQCLAEALHSEDSLTLIYGSWTDSEVVEKLMYAIIWYKKESRVIIVLTGSIRTVHCIEQHTHVISMYDSHFYCRSFLDVANTEQNLSKLLLSSVFSVLMY